MSFRSVARAWLGALLLLGLAPGALAQTDSPAVAPTPAAPLRVWVDPQGVPLDAARLQESLARELKREVTLANDPQAADVRIQLKSEARAEVRYQTPEGEQLSRDVELPPDRERSLQVLSWLTVNLVRDEASELLAQLRARRKAEAEARAAEERAAAEKAAADKAAADKAAADKAAADKAAADAARAKAQADAAAASAKPKDELLRSPFKSIDVALATPIALLPDSAKRELRVQLALGYGDAGQIRGIQVSPAALRIRRDLEGLSVGAGYVQIDGNAYGIAASAGYPRVVGKLQGIGIGAGVASAGTLEGALLGTGATWVSKPSHGLMVSGGGNLAGDLRGAQFAGGINIARDLQGVALAPVNVQRRVRGIQIGVVNVAEEVDGAAIGVVSLARNGRLQPVLWGSGFDPSAHVALKSIAGYVFTQLGGGIGLNGKLLSYDGGIGAHLKLGSLFFEPGLHYAGTHRTADASGSLEAHYIYYLAMVGLRLGNKVDLLGGGGLRQLLTGTGDATGPEVRAGIAFF